MSIAEQVRIARAAVLKRWLLDLDPTGGGPPNDLSFREIHIALNQIEARVAECRDLYPFTPPKDDTEAIVRSLPAHLRSDQAYGRPQERSERAVETYVAIYGNSKANASGNVDTVA